MPAAARVGDLHECPKHPDGVIAPTGCATVRIGARPAARVGDEADCDGPRDAIVMGEPTVYIGDKMAARVGDPFDHGGVVVEGCATVLVGSSAQFGVMREAARRGSPFAEECPLADHAWRTSPDQIVCLREAARRGAPLLEECPPTRGRS